MLVPAFGAAVARCPSTVVALALDARRRATAAAVDTALILARIVIALILSLTSTIARRGKYRCHPVLRPTGVPVSTDCFAIARYGLLRDRALWRYANASVVHSR